MHQDWITAVCLGLALSASCGFRVFVPLLIASVGGKFGWLHLQDSFQWLGTWTSIICFASASVFEILAYYIPFFDNLLDTITTPLAVLAGTLMATSVLPIDQSLLKWVSGFIIGGGSAALIQSGTAIIRLFSSKTSAGTANAAVSTGENIAAFSTPSLALIMPVIVGIAVLLLIVSIIFRLSLRIQNRKKI